MRILVTGATGFVGRAVVARLRAEGHQVIALVHIRSARFAPDVDLVRADILDRSSMRATVAGADAIIHLAADGRNHTAEVDQLRSFRHNVCGTVNLLELLARDGACRSLVFASTSLVYGDGRAEPFTEDAKTGPIGAYAASKLSAEYAINALVRSGRIGATVLRACNISGAVGDIRDEDRSRVVPRMLGVASGALADTRLVLDANTAREFLHVHDFARALSMALRGSRPGCFRRYNVGTGRPLTLAELAGLASEVSGRQIPHVAQRRGAGAGTVLLDSGRIARELGWRPRIVDPRRILADAWAAEQRMSLGHQDRQAG